MSVITDIKNFVTKVEAWFEKEETIAKNFAKNIVPAITTLEQEVASIIAQAKQAEPTVIADAEEVLQALLALKGVLAAL